VSAVDPRIDAYIAKAEPFARPILEYIRTVMHAACPQAVETIKWGFPHFTYKDKLLVISEDRGFAFFINPDGTLGGLAPYPPSGLFLEHLNPVTGRTDTGACLITKGCTLTQGGYKNHFNSQVLQLPTGGLWLGNNFYTNAQLDSIIQNNAIRGNGLLSLAHQLITAELNIYYGAQVTPAVALAIVQAQALIGNLTIPPVGSDSLPTSDTSSIQSILDTFNNGNSAGGPGHC